ncbi:4-hydroxy-tetrahydrodipicolinate reductase [Clostridium sp. BJN0001]|uniref:4-hydroxy-tetrahydrodipicolinate reductase n=1 Tax=Clostridium sp. BJN0001 TaxID=2930219 RepID=UPI001FD47666|nr:4-hydroxy-tetrahydrodipicolinate reductase [Clostridium sp. BJN0001]
MIKVLLNGCSGKMGKMITECSKKYNNIEIIAGIDKFNDNMPYPVFKSPSEVNLDYDVLLDFSRADALENLIDLTEKTKKPFIICSTGFSDKQIELINEKSKSLPLFRSGNMSLGINVLCYVLKKIAPILNDSYDVEIIEKHHNQKVDAPSGTALMLADSIKNSVENDMKYVYGRHGSSKREKNDIGIHAIRGGTIAGEHDVLFAGASENITFSHEATSRELFAVGAIKACIYMSSITKPGLYDMTDVLNLK